MLGALCKEISVVQRPPGHQPLSLVTPLPPMSPLQLALRKAHDQGEDTSGFHLMCSVMEGRNAQGQPER